MPGRGAQELSESGERLHEDAKTPGPGGPGRSRCERSGHLTNPIDDRHPQDRLAVPKVCGVHCGVTRLYRAQPDVVDAEIRVGLLVEDELRANVAAGARHADAVAPSAVDRIRRDVD